MEVIAIIPARYDSTRFPGKPLAILESKPLIQHVFENVKTCDLIKEVIVATDDQKIFETVDSFGGKVMLTGKKHRSGTDRIAEVCRKNPLCNKAEIIINVQGDEPFISAEPLRKLVAVLEAETDVQIATLMHKIDKNANDHNNVKVVFDRNKFALYFSRSLIPHKRDADQDLVNYYKHIGVYAFRRKALFDFVELAQGKLEQIEKLEQLRLLENGYKIKMVETEYSGFGIDTPRDLERARKLITKNKR